MKYTNWKKDVMPTIQERLKLWTSQQIRPTLRGLFYTLVSLHVLQNTPSQYNYLSEFTARARENSKKVRETRYRNGKQYDYHFDDNEILPIDCFADNVRRIIDIDDIYETPEEFFDRGANYYIKDISKNYKIPRWRNQPHYVEVWIEKDAMAGTLDSIINVAGKREVRIVPTRGQESVTFAWEHVQRLKQKMYAENKKVHIRYFGDLDPSGEAIERELINKLTEPPYEVFDFDWKRVGVTNEQRIQFRLEPNEDPKTMKKLKRDGNRFAFMDKYNLNHKDGSYDESKLFQVEVDALEAIAPEDFRNLVLESVDEFFNEGIYQDVLNNAPTELDLNELAKTRTSKLLASLEN